MSLNFNGKTVLVTGAGSGIGEASASLFAERDATVFVADINADAAAQTVSRIA